MGTSVVVMGVAGSGKTTVGRELAARLDARFVDADDVHPASNVTKMAAGLPLTDDDRAPWLDRLRNELSTTEPVVVTCSALKRRYREALRRAGPIRFVWLDIEREVAARRIGERSDHFMPATLVDSQFADLEAPTAEPDVARVDGNLPQNDVVDAAVAALADTVRRHG